MDAVLNNVNNIRGRGGSKCRGMPWIVRWSTGYQAMRTWNSMVVFFCTLFTSAMPFLTTNQS